MAEGPPIDIGLAVALLVAPLQQLQVVFHRVLAVPVDPLVVGDAGFLVRRPDLHRPEQRTHVLVDPVLRAGDDLLGVVLEVVPDAHGRVARELGADVRHALVHPQVFGRHVVVALHAHGPQDDAAVGVKADRRANVRVVGDEVHHGAHFGLAGGIGARAHLLELLPPVGGEVAVEVETFAVGVGADLQSVEVLQRAFGDQPVVLATEFTRLARHHHARVALVLLVGAVRVGHAHLQHAAVAVDVFHRQAFYRLFVVGVVARAAANMARLVGQRQLGAVGVQARHHVDHARVQQVLDLHVGVVSRQQLVQPVQAGGAGSQLGGVDVAVHPEGGLVGVGAGAGVRQRQQPDVAAFMALAQAAELHELRRRIGVILQQAREFVVAVELVETRYGQRRHGAGVRRGQPSDDIATVAASSGRAPCSAPSSGQRQALVSSAHAA